VSGLVVDTSAAVAILTREEPWEDLLGALDTASQRLMSAATYVELGIVLEARLGAAAGGIADRFVRDAGIEVIPVDIAQAQDAVSAWRRFGKGRHAAALNYGDCFTYALAALENLPVLCVGTDFPRSDIDTLP
jgi:ribonuclease VapC